MKSLTPQILNAKKKTKYSESLHLHLKKCSICHERSYVEGQLDTSWGECTSCEAKYHNQCLAVNNVQFCPCSNIKQVEVSTPLEKSQIWFLAQNLLQFNEDTFLRIISKDKALSMNREQRFVDVWKYRGVTYVKTLAIHPMFYNRNPMNFIYEPFLQRAPL